MKHQEIPIVNLEMELDGSAQTFSRRILENEIKDIQVEHFAVTGINEITDTSEEGHKTIYLFLGGTGNLVAANEIYELTPETIFLPGIVESITITAGGNDPLQYLKISSKLTAQDQLDLTELPSENTEKVYYAKFKDCQPYSETIKSPNTVSRTILPNKYIPRVAMGTVETKGPDKVGAHKHPMLEQLFVGLSKNNCTVYADDAETNFPENSVLHIPLGSTHSVSVEKGEVMYYVWIDFFLNKEGEEWLKTHKEDRINDKECE